MKTISIFTTAILLATTSFSQVAFQVISNPCNPVLEQSYPLIYVDTFSTGWNCPDITNPSNAVQAELVFANDGTTLGVFTNIGTPVISVETTTDACDSATWTQDLIGKIAVIWRGGCEFSCKAKNAQDRGAIAVVIINHTGEAVGMAGGTCGLNVTIPVIMIGRQDGENLMNCIVSGGVIGFIGNTSSFSNNMSANMGDILMSESLAMPWDLAQNGIEYPVDFGIWAYNNGTASQNGVTASVEVIYNGSIVYSQTSTPVDFAAPDTTYKDSNYFDLGTFAPALWNIGIYTVTYTINNIGDQFLSDNTFSFDFKFTNNEDIYAKCSTDNLNLPIHNISLIPSINDCGEPFESCIVFKNEYAGTRNTVTKGMTLSSQAISSVENQLVEIRAYQWNDSFIDINSPVTFNNLSLIDSVNYIYPDNTLNNANLYLPFNFPIALQNNQRYLFCVRNMNPDNYSTGYDTQIDYTTTVNHYFQPISPVSVISSCSGSKEWYRDGFGLDVVPAISVTMDIATNVNEAKKEAIFFPYPNPTANLLTVPLRQYVVGKLKIEVYDVLGKVVLTENKTISNEPLQLNVASIVNGNYLFKLTFSDGTSDVFKVSINR
jgi:hypothetical protein